MALSFDECWVLRWFRGFKDKIACGYCKLDRDGGHWRFRWYSPVVHGSSYGFEYRFVPVVEATNVLPPEEIGQFHAQKARRAWGQESQTSKRETE